ncbi:hypothetical protein CK203_042241 [Vitis vinifera]|uniref:HMA domain-containing protein n=1 Tax=Vitis vinifera TaxID=29760 RepID=A0A438H7V0_VITVI|nr:hypothetical protein CK203_042241 [Vitis vinifera]
MVLKVDLGCERCCKKIRKLICKIPEIKEYAFHEKDNAVMIKVVCCCPEKIKTKLICKGGKIIHSIEPEPPADKPKPPADKPNPQADKPKVPVPTPVTGYPPFIYPPGCHPMMAGLLGVAVTEAMVAALGVESVISPFGFFSPPQHQGSCLGRKPPSLEDTLNGSILKISQKLDPKVEMKRAHFPREFLSAVHIQTLTPPLS